MSSRGAQEPRDHSPVGSGRQKRKLGATKKEARGDKKSRLGATKKESSGRQKSRLRGTAEGLTPIYKTASLSLGMFIEKEKLPLALNTLCGLLKW